MSTYNTYKLRRTARPMKRMRRTITMHLYNIMRISPPVFRRLFLLLLKNFVYPRLNGSLPKPRLIVDSLLVTCKYQQAGNG